MRLVILLIMIGVPTAEIVTFIEIGGYLGLWPTIGIVILTAIIGTTLLKRQGLSTFYSAQESLLQNRFPLEEVFDGLCLILAGTLLLTPGFITDIAGLLLFAPTLRVMLRRLLTGYIVARSHLHMDPSGAQRNPDTQDATVIDGEYEDLTANREENDNQVSVNPKQLES